MKIENGSYPVISVKTAAPIPKEKISTVMKLLAEITVYAPLKVGDVVVKDISGTGIDIVTTIVVWKRKKGCCNKSLTLLSFIEVVWTLSNRIINCLLKSSGL